MKRFPTHGLAAALLVGTLLIFISAVPAQYDGNVGKHTSPRIQTHRNFIGSPRTVDPNRENRILVILAEYADQSFFFGKDNFVNMLTLPSYSLEGATGSAKEYLDAQFGTDFTIDVVGPVKLPETRHYYGVNNQNGYDTHPATFVAGACILADSLLNVNFQDYDCDKDGFVDNLFVFYAGEDESQQMIVDNVRQNSDFMWSHSSKLSEGDYGKVLERDGVKIDRYACTSEIFLRYTSSGTAKSYMAPIGTFAHELMHTFGLVDMYDTDYAGSGGTAAGLWRTTCLMDAGNMNNNGNTPPNLNSIERERLGLLEYEELLTEGKKIIYPVGNKNAVAYRISNKADSSEYYVLECRYASQDGWDRFAGGSGILLYHIDMNKERKTASDRWGEISSYDRWNKYNETNARPDNQCADLIEADGRSDHNPSSGSFNDIKSIFFPQVSATAIGGTSSVPLTFRDGTKPTIYIYNISESTDGAISFYVRDSSSPVPPEPDAPPADNDMLYIIVQGDMTGMILSVNNQFGASVTWTFDDRPIEDPKNFRPEKSGTVKAVICWPDGSQDVLYKKITK